MSMAPTNIATGAEVFTADGNKLGTVKAVRSDQFHVDVSMQPDYWLPCSCVTTSAGGRVTVAFSKDRLGDYKQEARGENN